MAGHGGSCGILCLLCWLCNNHGPSAWISGTELLKWGKKEKNGALPQGKMISQRCAAVGSAFCWSSQSDDKCELITHSNSFCCRISLSVSGQTRGQKGGDTLLASAPLENTFVENTKLHFSCCVSEKTGAVDQEHCASLPVLWLTAACL